jgi:hypothetical protein
MRDVVAALRVHHVALHDVSQNAACATSPREWATLTIRRTGEGQIVRAISAFRRIWTCSAPDDSRRRRLLWRGSRRNILQRLSLPPHYRPMAFC